MKNEVVLIRPGDLHLTVREKQNYQIAEWMIAEANELVKPDFVQLAGDNVQDAAPDQYKLLQSLLQTLEVPWRAMPGDHDVVEDRKASKYLAFAGEHYSAFEMAGFKFIQLNTCEARPLGFSDSQMLWFEQQLLSAQKNELKVIVFQHHYPFKVCESFEGPGVDRWRDLIRKFPVEAVLTGHTHYGQKANDGLNLFVATRSIGDPEGGSSGYHVFYCNSKSFACAYREFNASGPIVLITSPREMIFSRHGRDIVDGAFRVEAKIWSHEAVNVTAWIDEGVEFELRPEISLNHNASSWSAEYSPSANFKKGIHALHVRATTANGDSTLSSIKFVFDRTGRYTGLPMLEPAVELTDYC